MKIKIHPLVDGRISIHFSSKTDDEEDTNKTAHQLSFKSETLLIVDAIIEINVHLPRRLGSLT